MPASNKKVTRYHYIVFFSWLILTLIAAIYFISNRLVLFDPQMKLTGKSSDFVIEQVRNIAQLKGVNLNNTIIHFTSSNCSCTQFSKEHKAAINQQAEQENFTVLNISLPPSLSTIIPSTPSILIMDNIESLLYLGPYSTGLSCTQSNGYVETVLQNYAYGFNSDLIINDVEGCYCNI